MIPRKKRIAIWASIIILIIVSILGIGVFLYLKADIFQSKETLFTKYLMQNIDILEILEDTDKLEIKSILENNKYESEMTGNIQYTENIGTSGENKNNKINDVGVKIKSKIDKENNYDYKDISIKNKNEDLVKLEYLKQDKDYGIRLNGIQQFVVQKNEEESKILKQFGIGNLEEMQLDVDINTILNSAFKLTKEEKQTLINTYTKVIKSNITKDKYFKQSKSLITINNQDVQTNAYYIKLTVEEYNDLLIKILEQMTKDEIILSKIDLIENQIKEINTSDEALRETFINKINDKIEKIRSNNIGTEEVKITVYESDQKTVRTTIEKTTNRIIIDLYNNSSIKINNIQLGQNENEQYIKIEKEANETQSDILIEFEKIQDNEVINNIKLNYKQTFENKEITKDIELSMSNEKYESILNIKDNIKLVDEFEEKTDLENDVVALDDLPEETLETVLGILNENIQNQISDLLSVVSIEDYITMLKNTGIINRNIVQLPNEIKVTDIERKRFNSQFEFFETKDLTNDNIKDLMQVVENNFEDMKVRLKNGRVEDLDIETLEDNSQEASEYKKNISEIQLIIKRDSKNNKKQEDMLKFLEDNNSNKYTATLEYDDDGLVNSVKLKIQED